MKVVITDYQYENIDSERSIITGAGYELFDYQVKTTPDLIPVVKDADAVITQYRSYRNRCSKTYQHGS